MYMLIGKWKNEVYIISEENVIREFSFALKFFWLFVHFKTETILGAKKRITRFSKKLSKYDTWNALGSLTHGRIGISSSS